MLFTVRQNDSYGSVTGENFPDAMRYLKTILFLMQLW